MAAVFVVVETRDAAWYAKAEPSEADKQADNEKNRYGTPDFGTHRALAFRITAMVAELALSLERFSCG